MRYAGGPPVWWRVLVSGASVQQGQEIQLTSFEISRGEGNMAEPSKHMAYNIQHILVGNLRPWQRALGNIKPTGKRLVQGSLALASVCRGEPLPLSRKDPLLFCLPPYIRSLWRPFCHYIFSPVENEVLKN